MKSFIKRHRYTLIIVLVVILLFILGIKVKEVLVPDEGKATYGERLKDVSKHPIDNAVYEKIAEEYGKNNNVKKVDHRIQGKILNYYITFIDKVSVKDAKALGEKLISYFDEDTLGYYSIQIYLLKDNEELNNFPIIGMKDPLSKTVSWTKDREIVTKSDEDEKE